MKTKTIILIFILLIPFFAFSQDLIVTNRGDSIKCRITGEGKGYIYYIEDGKDARTIIYTRNIESYTRGYYQTSKPVSSAKTAINNTTDFPHFRIAVNSGWSYNIAGLSDQIPDDFENYYKKLKSGFNVGGDFSYFFKKLLGVGVKYDYSGFSNSTNNVVVSYPDGSAEYGIMSDDISVHYVGPFFTIRVFDKKMKNAFVFGSGFGYMSYKNKGKLIYENLTFKVDTLVMSLDAGYDIELTKNLSLGFKFSLLTGSLSQYEVESRYKKETVKLEKNEYESLNRIELSAGLRFNLINK